MGASMRTLERKEIMDIIYGATFYGGGGGGSIKGALAMMKNMSIGELKINLYDLAEISDTDYAVMIAGLGSPVAMEEKDFGPEAVNVFNGIRKELKKEGRAINYIYSGEMGGFNTFVPMYAAIKTQTPMVDVDGNGRAVPEINTGLLPIYKIPLSPFALANAANDVMITFPNDEFDSVACETIARQMCMAYGMSIGFSTWIMDKDQMKEAAAVGQLQLAQTVGNVILKAKVSGQDVVKELQSVVEMREVVRGKITKIEIKTEGGFDHGTTTIQGKNGEEFLVDFKNENLLIRTPKGETLMTVPDIITMIDPKTCEPLSNADTAVGQTVSLIITPVDKKWWGIPEGYNCWREIMKQIGYTGEAVPFR